MLSKLQNPKVGYISRLLLLPLLTVLFTAFALKIKENDAASSIPRLEKSLTVVIDAGHGFNNGVRHGSIGLNGISEDEIALAIAKKIEQLNTDNNLKLVFTRKDEKFVDNKERVKITQENNADLFISIHANYAPPVKTENGTIENPLNGFELYVSNDNNPFLQISKELGSAIIQEVKSFIPIRKEGIKQRKVGIWVIEALTCPAVLLECGFISNSKDLAFLTDEKSQGKIAEAILKGIVNYATNKDRVTIADLITSIVSDTVPKPSNDAKTLLADQLIIINGKKSDKKTIDSFIISVNKVTVIKKNDKAAISKYGPEAKNGVIILEDAVISEKLTNEQPQQVKDTLPKSQGMVFTKTEIPATFPGGPYKWNNYISKQLEENIEAFKKEGISGTCEVQFIVDVDGTVSNVEALTMKNTKLATVAINAIAKGPKWVPAIQNGRHVRAWHREKIILNLSNANLAIGLDTPFVISGGNISENQLQANSNMVFVKTEVPPTFPGGEQAWNRYIQLKIEKNIDKIVRNKKSEGTCEVQFIVDKDGTVTNVEALTLKGSLLAKILVDAVKDGPKWVPAYQNGKPVKAWHRQKVTFRMP